MVNLDSGELYTSVVSEISSSQPASNIKSGGGGATLALADKDEVLENEFSDFQEYKRKCREEYKERWKEDDEMFQKADDAHRRRMLREHGKIPDLSGIDQSA